MIISEAIQAMLDMISLGGISVLVGFLGALTGLGGGSILIPIMAVAGIPLKEAIAAGMALLRLPAVRRLPLSDTESATSKSLFIWKCLLSPGPSSAP
jgi:hypothetical protein